MRVLITGIAGHIGSQFARWLLSSVPGVEVVGIDNLSSGYRENVPAEVKLLECDLLGAHAIMDHFGPVDYVFHFAAFAAECLSPFVRQYSLRNTAEITTALISAVIQSGGCRRFVFTSSMAVYGNGMPPFAEDDPCIPNDPYGAAKLYSEHDLRIAGEQHGLPWTILRPHNVYGPRQNLWAKYRNVLGLWMRAALEDEPLVVYGDGQQQRAFSYIDDCLPAIWTAATSEATEGEIINLGSAEPVEIGHAAQIVAKLCGASIEYREPRHEVKRAYCTAEKAQRLLGQQDRCLADGLAPMWEWAQDAWERFPERRAEPVIHVELDRGMYDGWLPAPRRLQPNSQ